MTTTLPARPTLQRRARAAGITGRVGGWLAMPTGRPVHGWSGLECWLQEQAARLPWNLAEIASGARVGVPTLRRSDPQELAAGLLAPGQVCWRD